MADTPGTLVTTRPAPDAGFRVQPHNIEAEQALLGAIMINNEAYNRVADFLLAEHFYEPVHSRIFEVCARLISQGQLADPVTLRMWFDEDPALREVEGARYLRDLAIAAETIVNAQDYARLIHDLALKRGLIAIGEEIVTTAFDPETAEGAAQQVEQAEQRLYALAQEGVADGGFREFPAVLSTTIGLVESAFRQSGQITGVPTLLTDLDEKLGGLQASDLVILAGRPSMGKTALAITIGANAATCKAMGAAGKDSKTEKFGVGVFSLEMSAEQLAMRLLSGEADIGSDDLRRGKLKDDDFHRVVAASQRLAARPLFIDDTPALSIAALRTRARRLKRRHGIGLIVVDYLQLLRGTSRQSEGSRVQEIGEITQGLKAIAKELNVPVLALSQLSRAVEQREDKRPQLSDLRESGSIEQDADVVMFVYRDEYYMERAEPKQRPEENADRFRERYEAWAKRFEESRGMADVIIAKQRNGPIGNVRMAFQGSRGRFVNAETHPYDVY
ncbi:replicative DNA helicase [Marinivivus vitaminiproducens]|uniref:replicative DNA helicase n=1 Tax=Marinivivus vitaminiproducens TaxID=3035935 RepID=UPI0027A54AE8|nr:replicative DNA helicase [Geminicoccaceae bacterium SCSIO 64248]